MRIAQRIFTPTGAMRAWATVLVVIICFGIALGLTIGYVNKRSRDICGVIRLIDDRNQSITPTSPDQRQFIDELHRYRVKLGC